MLALGQNQGLSQPRVRTDKNKTFKLFVHIMLQYATISAAEFGFDTNYTTEDG